MKAMRFPFKLASCKKNAHKRVFTLIELLVVLSIIGILAGILMPMLHRARARARQIACMSNLRHFGQGMVSYTTSYNGYYCPGMYSSTDTPWRQWDVSQNFATNEVTPGILWDSLNVNINPDQSKLFWCPALTKKDPLAGVTYFGYNYNITYLGHGSGESIEEPSKVTMVKKPGDTIMFGDGGGWDFTKSQAVTNKYMRAPKADQDFAASWATPEAGTQGFRHNEKTNILWADGHGSESEDKYDGGHNCAPGTGFISEDDSLYDLE